MKRRWIEYAYEWKPSPVSYWVHIEVGHGDWLESKDYNPPLPRPVPGLGFARFYVHVEDVTFEFASLDELAHCVDVLRTVPLPTTFRLSSARSASVGTGAAGPNSHWLSRLPAHAKSGTRRRKVLKYLEESLAWFRREGLR